MWAQEAFSGDALSSGWEADFLLRLLRRAVKKLVKRLSVVRESSELFFKAHVNYMVTVSDNPVI